MKKIHNFTYLTRRVIFFSLCGFLFACQQPDNPSKNSSTPLSFALPAPSSPVTPLDSRSKFRVFAYQNTGERSLSGVALSLYGVDETGKRLPSAITETYTTNEQGWVDILLPSSRDQGYALEGSLLGHASSRVQLFYPYTLGTQEVRMMLSPVESSLRSTNSPTLAWTGIAPFDSWEKVGTIDLTATGDNLFVSNRGRTPLLVALYGSQRSLGLSGNETLSFELDPVDLPPGDQILVFNAFDNNNNQTLIYLPLSQNPASEMGSFDIPGTSLSSRISLSAQTLGYEQKVMIPFALTEKQEASIGVALTVGGGRAEGLIVYRQDNPNTPYKRITTLTSSKDSLYQTFTYTDRSPELSLSATYRYRFSYLNRLTDGWQEGALSEPANVTILPIYELTLLSPAQGSLVDLSRDNISFSWRSVASAGDLPSGVRQFDQLILYQLLTDVSLPSQSQVQNRSVTERTTEYLYEIPSLYLSRGLSYSWNVTSQWQYVNPGSSSANITSTSISIAHHSTIFGASADNGSFHFITTDK